MPIKHLSGCTFSCQTTNQLVCKMQLIDKHVDGVRTIGHRTIGHRTIGHNVLVIGRLVTGLFGHRTFGHWEKEMLCMLCCICAGPAPWGATGGTAPQF